MTRPFPSGHLDEYGLFSFFYNEFHMTTAETVAIMGGHTLDGSTGFTGWTGFFWTGSEYAVKMAYYTYVRY